MQLFPYINAFGVELEGGWNRPFPRHYLFDADTRLVASEECECGDCGECDECEDFHNEHDGDEDEDGRYLHGDGSVTVQADYVGEIATPPYKTWGKFVADYRVAYPDRVNSSCGMHVHISMNEEMGDPVALYGSMMTPRFEKFILKGMKRWGTAAGVRPGTAFWRRLDGANDYCRAQWCPDEQVRDTDHGGNRYTRLNFAWSCRGRNTLEFRFLPMFENKTIGENAIRQLLRLSNRYLSIAAKGKIEARSTGEIVEISDDGVIEFSHVLADIGIEEEAPVCA